MSEVSSSLSLLSICVLVSVSIGTVPSAVAKPSTFSSFVLPTLEGSKGVSMWSCTSRTGFESSVGAMSLRLRLDDRRIGSSASTGGVTTSSCRWSFCLLRRRGCSLILLLSGQRFSLDFRIVFVSAVPSPSR
uniref:Putative secreted protein n=1 Tax=Anopheles darlingi TaxID=43151 RepID=A0A2M4D0L4_ANODA